MPFRLKYFYFLIPCCQLLASSLSPASPFLQQDEFLKFKITYLGIIGGYSTLEVIHDRENKKIIHLKLRAWTTPFVSAFYTLKMDLHSIVEKENLHTLHYTEYKIEKKNIYQHKIIVEPSKKQFNFYRELTKTEPDKTIVFTNRGYDTVASFYLSRLADFTQKENLRFASFFRDKIYHTTVLNLGREQIRYRWKRKEVIKVIPQMEFRGLFINTGHITIYLSDDEYRFPLVMTSELSVGKFKAILIERKLLDGAAAPNDVLENN